MKIAFIGDSVTEAKPGVSYVDIVKNKMNTHTVVNYGKGGDTVSSLLKRIKKINDLDTFDIIVLLIGKNDVFGKLTWQYSLLKTLMGQKWAKNKTVFTKQYLSLLDYLQTKNTNIIVIPPLILGENLNNSWNKEIEELVGIIKIIIQDYPKAFYLDIRSSFINYIKDKEQSDYIPYKVFALYTDLKNLKTNEDVDKKSQERGLYLTLDGVHINSKGANIIAEEIITQINKY